MSLSKNGYILLESGTHGFVEQNALYKTLYIVFQIELETLLKLSGQKYIGVLSHNSAHFIHDTLSAQFNYVSFVARIELCMKTYLISQKTMR